MKDIEIALKEAGFIIHNDSEEKKLIYYDSSGIKKVVYHYEFFDLTVLLGSHIKAATALKNGLGLSDFTKPEYQGLPVEWVYNMIVNNTEL